MDKSTVINYLEGQRAKLDQQGFDFEVWREATAAYLGNVFGHQHPFTRQIRSLEYEIKMSYEDLYPARVKDVDKSRKKFRAAIGAIIDQLQAMEAADFARRLEAGRQEGAEVLQRVVEALQNNLTGRQLKELQAAMAGAKKGADEQEALLEQIKKWNVASVQQILAEILTRPEIKDALKGGG